MLPSDFAYTVSKFKPKGGTLMRRKRPNRLTGFERLLLGVVVIFLSVTVLRTIQFKPFLQAQQTIQTFFSGDLSVEKAVEAIGSFTEKESLQAVFSDWFPTVTPQTSQPVAESVPPLQTLAATAAGVFPEDADTTVYALDLPCKTPVKNAVVTSRFGPRIHPISEQDNFHKGLDLAAEQGTPIYALADGVIRTATQSNSYGNYVILEHSDGICSLYAHCDTLFVSDGQSVCAGQKIASVGASGMATGNHLHLELWRAGKLLNPEDYMII